jgi:hypothetical protein
MHAFIDCTCLVSSAIGAWTKYCSALDVALVSLASKFPGVGKVDAPAKTDISFVMWQFFAGMCASNPSGTLGFAGLFLLFKPIRGLVLP